MDQFENFDNKEYLARLLCELSEKPNDPDCLIKIGRLFFEPLHDPSNALHYLRRAISEDPNNIEALFWTAKVFYHDYCDYEQAKDILEQIIMNNPDNPESLSLLASVLGDLDLPIEPRILLLKRAVHLAPDWVIPRYNLAILLMENRRLQEAEFYVREGLKGIIPIQQPNNPLTHYYENSVTGRAWREAPEVLEQLFQRIKNGLN